MTGSAHQSSEALGKSPWLTANIVSQLALGLVAMTICLPSMQQWPAAFGASMTMGVCPPLATCWRRLLCRAPWA